MSAKIKCCRCGKNLGGIEMGRPRLIVHALDPREVTGVFCVGDNCYMAAVQEARTKVDVVTARQRHADLETVCGRE